VNDADRQIPHKWPQIRDLESVVWSITHYPLFQDCENRHSLCGVLFMAALWLRLWGFKKWLRFRPWVRIQTPGTPTPHPWCRRSLVAELLVTDCSDHRAVTFRQEMMITPVDGILCLNNV